jgi:hypothetical protein
VQPYCADGEQLTIFIQNMQILLEFCKVIKMKKAEYESEM